MSHAGLKMYLFQIHASSITNNDQSIYLFLSPLFKIIFTDILTFEWINKIKKKKENQHRDDDDVDEMHLRVDEM